MAKQTMVVQMQQRYDTAENWVAKNPILLSGEMGVESDTRKFKFGDGVTNWENLNYAGIDITQIQSLIDTAEDNHYSIEPIEEEDLNKTDNELLGGIENPKKGDTATIKRQIVDDKYSYTAYVFDGVKWEAMDGNYNASNVYIDKEITLAGDYTSVGNYSKGDTINAGTSLESLLSGLLQQELEPGDPTLPSASISASGGTGEVGVEYTVPTATLKIDSIGSYTYGPETGVTFAIGDVKLAEGNDPTTATNYKVNENVISATGDALTLKATGDKAKYTDSAVSYVFSGSVDYQAATKAPVTNLGNERSEKQISAGSCTVDDKTVSFTGWRRMYMGAVAADATINSDTIKGIGTKTTTNVISEKASKSAKTFTAPIGTAKLLIAFPRTTSTKSPKVEYFTMSWESFGDFTLATEKVKVADASGVLLADTATADEYMVYAYTPADPLKADTQFRVTLQ